MRADVADLKYFIDVVLEDLEAIEIFVNGDNITLGSIITAPIAFLPEKITCFQIKEIDEYNQTLTLRFRNDVERVFRDRERVQPLPEFNLSAGEELVMAKVKMRPCIVISKYRKKNIKGYMVFPLTSFKGNTKEELIRAFKTCTFNRPFSWLIKTIDVRHYNPTNPVYDYSMILMHHLRFVNERYVRKGKTRISERAFRYMIIHFFYSMGLLNFSIEKGEDRNFITSLKELRDVQQLGKDILRKYCK